MDFTDRIWSWFEHPVASVPSYQCTECGAPTPGGEPECPECGGEIRRIHAVTYPDIWQ